MSVLEELARFEPFRGLGEGSRRLLAGQAVARSAARAAAVIFKGQPVSGAYIVLSGRLRVFSIAPNGTEATLYWIEPGETCVLALNCLFNDALYPAWVETEAPTSIAFIPGPVYRTLFENEPAVRALTVQTLATLVSRLMIELEQIHACGHRERLAHFLILHAAGDGTVRTTQQEIARHLGTTREGIARLVRELVGLGLVSSGRGVIVIRDLFGLRRLVAPDPAPPKSKRAARR